MDIVRDSKVDWIGLKWIFLGVSLLLILVGGLFVLVRGLNLGVDFTGGTLVYVKFREEPDLERIRRALADLQAEEVIRFDELASNQVQVRMAQIEGAETEDVTLASNQVVDVLRREYDSELVAGERLDLNNISRTRLSSWLQESDPEALQEEKSISEFIEYYDGLSARLVDYRSDQSGIIHEYSELAGLEVAPAVMEELREGTFLGNFTVISVESVGPKVGEELRSRARAAVFFSLLGMLAYIAIRFKPIYGVAAIVALFHDVFITLCFFSVTNREISLTVIAALLTLVGYSINDTIVVFDRVRENLNLMRRSDLTTVFNSSINQTLNRTIMTSGMTFLAVFALYLFGGQVLEGFSLALVIGILVGTYSSIAIASPVVLWWHGFREARGRGR